MDDRTMQVQVTQEVARWAAFMDGQPVLVQFRKPLVLAAPSDAVIATQGNESMHGAVAQTTADGGFVGTDILEALEAQAGPSGCSIVLSYSVQDKSGASIKAVVVVDPALIMAMSRTLRERRVALLT